MSRPYITQKLNENEDNEKTVILDNKQISTKEFNNSLEKLKRNQKIIETKENQFYTIERFYD